MGGKNQYESDLNAPQLNKRRTNKNSNGVFHKQEQRAEGSQDIAEEIEIGKRKTFPTSY